MENGVSEIIFVAGSCMALGALLGLYISKIMLAGRIERARQEAYDHGRAEFDKERCELSGDLSRQLGKIRDSIVQTIDSYEGVVRTMEERLPVTSEDLGMLHGGSGGTLEVEYSAEAVAKNTGTSLTEIETVRPVLSDTLTDRYVNAPAIAPSKNTSLELSTSDVSVEVEAETSAEDVQQDQELPRGPQVVIEGGKLREEESAAKEEKDQEQAA